MKALVLMMLGCLVSCTPCLLLAGEKPNQLLVEPGVGIQLDDPDVAGLNKNVDSVYDPDVFLGAQYLHDLNQRLAMGLDINFLGDSSATRRFVSGAPTAWQTKSLVVLAVLHYEMASTALGTPYLFLGLGAHRTILLVDDNLKPIIDSAQWGVATALGAGWKIPIREPFLLSIESRWQYLTATHYAILNIPAGTTTATAGRAQPSSLDLLLRVGRRF